MIFSLDELYHKLYNVISMKRRLVRELEQYRLENRISQRKLAELLGVTFATVNRWFNGHASPNQIHEYHIRKLLEGAKKK